MPVTIHLTTATTHIAAAHRAVEDPAAVGLEHVGVLLPVLLANAVQHDVNTLACRGIHHTAQPRAVLVVHSHNRTQRQRLMSIS